MVDPDIVGDNPGTTAEWPDTSSVVKRSEHDPNKYFLSKIVAPHQIHASLVSKVYSEFLSVTHAAERTRPLGKSNKPNYKFILHHILLSLNQPEQAAKVPLRKPWIVTKHLLQL